MRKIILAKILIAVTLLMPLNSYLILGIHSQGYSVSEHLVDTESIIQKSNNNYNKLHFYFDNQEHYTIDDMEELKTAIDDVSKSGNSSTYRMLKSSKDSAEEVTMKYK